MTEIKNAMELESYPKIGSMVSFVRQSMDQETKGDVVTGKGIVHAICLDPRKRLMVHVSETQADGSNKKFNVDMNCINPTDNFIEEFKIATESVKTISAEGNKVAQDVINDYNARVEIAYDGVLGNPIEIGE